MPNENLILGTLSTGKKITAKECKILLNAKQKDVLADFIYNRLYGRYIKPFDFKDRLYESEFKNGFALMASSCLLIETYVSFRDIKYINTHGQSGECFGYFFTTESRFSALATGGLQANGKISTSKQGGIPNDFYQNVRCGILHNAETRNGWSITRSATKPYFNPTSKELNATKFSNRLVSVLKQYATELKKSDFDNDIIWTAFKARLNNLMNNS